MGTKWCCSGFREPESKVYADPGVTGPTDVRQFVEESRLTLNEEAEMKAVADTFRGVENLDGVFNWEGTDGSIGKAQQHKEWRHLNLTENYGKDHTTQARSSVKVADPEFVKHVDLSGIDGWMKAEPQRKRFLSSLWKKLPPKASNKNAVELIEFARDVGNEEGIPHQQ